MLSATRKRVISKESSAQARFNERDLDLSFVFLIPHPTLPQIFATTNLLQLAASPFMMAARDLQDSRPQGGPP